MTDWEKTKCGTCVYQRKKPICNSCIRFQFHRPMTNAECIRSMSDEELAEYIFGVSESLVPCTNCLGECDFCELSDTDCKKKILDWLQSEAE